MMRWSEHLVDELVGLLSLDHNLLGRPDVACSSRSAWLEQTGTARYTVCLTPDTMYATHEIPHYTACPICLDHTAEPWACSCWSSCHGRMSAHELADGDLPTPVDRSLRAAPHSRPLTFGRGGEFQPLCACTFPKQHACWHSF